MRNQTPRHGFTLWQVTLVLATLGILAAILFPIFGRTRENAKRSSCYSNLKQINLGFKQYIQDYDEKYPLGATSKLDFGWAGALQPYLRSTQIFQCSQEKTPPKNSPSQLGYTDYWFNARLSARPVAEIEDWSRTITIGDGNSGNARYNFAAIPKDWRDDSNSPLYRHDSSANFAFADGHVKRISGDEWKTGLETVQGLHFSP